jgi:CheY-like chemotaxis protein/CRP-like cAMP-binding protein
LPSWRKISERWRSQILATYTAAIDGTLAWFGGIDQPVGGQAEGKIINEGEVAGGKLEVIIQRFPWRLPLVFFHVLPSHKSFTMRTILLIEDNPDMRDNTTEILELADYRVLTAIHGKEGVKMAKQERPDLIICDIMMPELDGYGVLRMLGANAETASIPFIFLTAKAEKIDFRKGMNLGADDYIAKPFDDVELLDAIEIRLKKHQAIHQDYPNNAQGLDGFMEAARGLETLEVLSETQQTRLYKAKEVIFHEASYPYGLLLINKGKVRTYKANEDGKEYATGLHKTGDYLGYLPMLRDTPYQETAMAMDDTDIIVIPKEDFFALIYNNRDVSNKFIQMLSDSLNEKEEELLHLAYDSVRKRVADALLQLERKFHNQRQEVFKMSVTRDHLASLVGTSKECVIRVLSDFKEEGLVETKMSEIRIIDSEGLAKVRF